jgi:hypothetical protein
MVCQTVALYQSGKGLDGFGLQARRVGACAFKRRVVSYLSFAEQGIQNLVLIMVKHRTINPRLIDDSWNYQAIKLTGGRIWKTTREPHFLWRRHKLVRTSGSNSPKFAGAMVVRLATKVRLALNHAGHNTGSFSGRHG